MRRVTAVLTVLGCLFAVPALAVVCPTATDTFKNAGGVTNTLCIGGTAATAEIFQHQILDSAGVYAFPAAAALADNIANPTTITLGSMLLGWDATNSVWRRIQVDAATGTVKVDGSSATQPVSGTVTANAGTNLNTSALALDTSVNGLLLGQASTTSGQKGPLALGAVTTSAPSYTTAQSDPLSLTLAGALRVDGSGVSQPVNGTVSVNALPIGANVIGKIDILGNVGQAMDFNGQNAAQPANSLLTGCEFNTSPTTITSGNASPIQCTAAARLIVDGSQVTQPVSGTVSINAIPTGANTIGKVDVLGNAGAILDFAGQNAAQPANSLLTGCAFNTTPTTVTSGNATQIQCDSAGNALVKVNVALPTGANTIGAVTQASGPWTSNVTQIASNAVSTAASGTQKVGIVGNAAATLDATVAAGTAPTNGLAVLGQYNTTVPTPSATQTVALQTNQNGYILAEQGCAGQSVANTSVKPFSLASTTALKIIPLVSGKKVYICSINIVSAAPNNVALIEGTKTTNDCDTSTAGLAGGTTGATGWNFAANGGLTLGNGQGMVAKSGTASLDVCLLASATGQLSGTVVYAQF